MMPLKWKVYRIMNYVLLICGAFIFLRFFELSIRNKYQIPIEDRYRVIYVLCSLMFLFMALQGVINLVIMSKNFPDKILTGAKNRWHILATILNGVSLSALTYSSFSLMFEIADYPAEDGLIIMLLILIALMLSALFVFICQLTLKKYLQRNNNALVKSMIDSIGNDA